MIEPGLERTHKSQHPVQVGLYYQEKRDMIILNTHILPVNQREKRRCHHHWISQQFYSASQTAFVLKTHQIIPDDLIGYLHSWKESCCVRL